jgi:DNA-binding GntR family transcriptional regulator
MPHPKKPGRSGVPAGAGNTDAAPRPTILKIPRQTVASMTLEAIRERILRGVYPEGEPLRQDSMAEELGVSRIPIREALRQLEAEGLVTFNPHRGAVVSSLSLAEIEEVFALRSDIETSLLRLAIPQLTPEHLSVVEEILDRYEAAFRAGLVADWGELNWQFHSTICAPSNRPISMGILQRLHQQSDRYSRMHLALTHAESVANEEHRAIAAAAARKDAKRACQLLRDHVDSAGRSLVTFLREQREGTTVTRRGKQARA